MLFKTILLLASLTLTAMSGAFASEVININGKPGGLSGKLAEAISLSAKESSKKSVEVKYLGNCKIGENLYNQAQKSDSWIMNLAATTDTSQCKFSVEPDNLVDVVYGQSAAVCYQKDRKELGVKHFLDPAQRKVWMTMNWFKSVNTTWAKDLGITDSAKVIAVGHSREVAAASLGREGDYFTMDITTAIENRDRLACMFTTSQNRIADLNGTPTLKEFNAKVRFPEVYASQVILVSNKQSKATFQSLINEAKAQPTWKKFVSQPGIEVFDNIDKWKFFKDQQKMLNLADAEAKGVK